MSHFNIFDYSKSWYTHAFKLKRAVKKKFVCKTLNVLGPVS